MAHLAKSTAFDTERPALSKQIADVRSMSADSGRFPTKFTETLLLLSEVTTQLVELDEALVKAAEEQEDEKSEAKKWREISMSTMKFAKTSLVDQQLRAIEILTNLSSRGASILKEPEPEIAKDSSVSYEKPAAPMVLAVPPPPGLSLAPPPGLAPPPPPSPPKAVGQDIPITTIEQTSKTVDTATVSGIAATAMFNFDDYTDSEDDSE